MMIKRMGILTGILATLLLFSSCTKEEVFSEDHAPTPLLSNYGSCSTCQLPTSISGPLSGVLVANSTFLDVLNDCYTQSPADLSGNCVWRSRFSPVEVVTDKLVQFGQNWGNDWNDHCSFLYQIGNAALAAEPSGSKWLLEEIVSVTHLGNCNYRIKSRWRKYICEYPATIAR